MADELIVRPCLVCDVPTAINRKEWFGEMPAAFCLNCCKLISEGKLPWSVVRMLYMLRCALTSSQGEMELVRRDIQRIYNWQKEVDEERLGVHH